MLHKITLALILAGTVSCLSADTIRINPDHPDEHVVEKGDTLWDISARFLTQPWRWPEIWQVNPQIENPHLIYPGDIVRLRYDGETPVLTVERGVATDRRTAAETVRLSPAIRPVDRADAIHSIPIDAIGQFLTRPLVVSEREMTDWPYIVSSEDQRLIAGSGDDIYVRGLGGAGNATKYSIYRKGPEYRSRSTGKEVSLGYEAIYIGDAVIKATGDPAVAYVSHAVREVLTGDRLIAQSEDEIQSDFIPSTPDRSINGSIISARDVLTEIGQYRVVTLDRGKADGVATGNVLGVYQSGRVVTDRVVAESGNWFTNSALVEYLGKPKARGEQVELPEVHAAVVMVFRVFDRVSYALVMEATRPVHLHDTVRNF